MMQLCKVGRTPVLICLLAGAMNAGAQTYPAKPLRMVVPYPPGGATDVIGRVIAQKLSDALSQQVVVDNRAGASGNIGADMVAKAPLRSGGGIRLRRISRSG